MESLVPAKGTHQTQCKRGHSLTEDTRFANGACKLCRRISIKAWEKLNPEKMKHSRRKWVDNNPEKQRESCENWRLAHMKECSDKTKRWQKSHPLTPAQKERKYKNSACWAKEHPERLRVIEQKHRTLVAGNGGYFTAEEWFLLCFACGFRCLCCGEIKPLAADHVVPVVKGGSSWLHNIQPLCRNCNSRKGTKATDYRYPQEIQCKTQQNIPLECNLILPIPTGLAKLLAMV